MTDEPANSPGKQGRFAKGVSGNPAGKPPGTRHRTTIMAEALMTADAKDVVAAILAAAKAGDMAAARMVLDRIAPLPRNRPVTFDMPPITTAAEIVTALESLMAAAGDGLLTPDELATLAGVVEIRRKALETGELAARLDALEAGNTPPDGTRTPWRAKP